jgi:Fe-S cluster assembly iron-binding protein IscA
MLNVSEKAREALHHTLDQNEREGSDLLRIALTEEGLALALDKERDGDQLVEHDQRKILAVEPELARELDGATIDAVETPEGMRLVFEPPTIADA